MDDRTLIEMAAKAAGFELPSYPDDHDEIGRQYTEALGLWVCRPWGWGWFNPLNDDGDEARLEAALWMHVHWWGNCVTVDSGIRGLDATEFFAEHGGDKQAARRLAGVRAAAALAERRTGGRE